jgi:aspartate oxidase
MEMSLKKLDRAWTAANDGFEQQETGRARMRAREAAAMLLTARWIYRAASHRKETRGLHRRLDYPAGDPKLQRNIRVHGLNVVHAEYLDARRQAGSLSHL